jgi:hypothetical protein
MSEIQNPKVAFITPRSAVRSRLRYQSFPYVSIESRILAVHSKARIPVPSKDQAIMVIHAVVDTVNRVIVSPVK